MKLDIHIPETLSDIKLSSWQNFAKVEEPTDYDILRCFYGIDTKGVFDMKSSDVARLVSKITTVLSSDPKELVQTFNLGGVDFGFIPKLDDMTYGENTDLTTYINDLDQAHRAMAVMYRPIVKKSFGNYLIVDYEGTDKTADIMRSAPLEAYLTAKVFFCDLTKDLLNHIPAYIKEANPQLTAENGDLIQHYVDWLETDLNDLMQWQKKMYINV